jgi:DNA polymerase III subunit epsilon
MDFVAIDFETANPKRCSACALGIAVVAAGHVVERRSWLIRPPDLDFSHFNIAIHGIRPEDVEDKPRFSELWPTVAAYLADCIVVAHNAAFDLSVLANTLDTYGVDCPDLEYTCTRDIAKVVWPKLPTYNLKYVATFLGIEFQHHDAMEDAVACAEIGIRACMVSGVRSMPELDEFISSHATSATDTGEARTERSKVRRTAQVRARDICPSSNSGPRPPFVGRTFVFTGALCSMDRREAMQVVADAGGTCSDSINKRTNALVVGGLYSQTFGSGYQTGKLKKASSLIKSGADLEIITEDDFLKMLHV